MNNKVLAIIYPGCILFEIMVALEMISDSFPIVTVSINKDPIKMNNGLTVIPDITFNEIDLNEYKYILIPGGDVKSIIENKEIDAVLRSAVDNPKIFIGGICNGALVMAKTGILDGKKCTHTCHESCGCPQEIIDMAAPYFKNTIYANEDIVVVDRMVTARPGRFVEFATTLFQLGEGFSNDKVEMMTKYFKSECSF